MEYTVAVIVFTIGETIGLIIFFFLRKWLGPKKGSLASKWSTMKGILERLTLFIGLLYGFPQVLIAFAALKLGTRLHGEKDSDISNTYFLVGNLISILLAMTYVIITKAY